MEEINLIISNNLKAFRDDKKLSLERFSEPTGVSKTMIGQIERGESSPTITTIWKVVNVLKISFTSLINNLQPATKVILQSEIQDLSEDDGKYRVYPSFHFQDDRRFEVYSIEIGGFLSGASINFEADVPHSYQNTGETLTRLSIIIHYPA